MRITARLPYPLALQGLVSLVLIATPLNALSAGGGNAPFRLWVLCGLVLLHLLTCSLVPIRRLRCWQQLAVLIGQCGLVALAYAALPVTMLTYVMLAVVLQAIYLFRPWVWVPFACLAWLGWNGTSILVSSNLLDWLQRNLTLVFPAMCILTAAIMYARQHHRRAQVQHLLDQMQQHYDTLLLALQDAHQRAAQEERQRLMQTISSDIAAALANTEQSVLAAISQAQTNLAKFSLTVAQTRQAAGAAIDRLRSTVATLRGEHHDPASGTAARHAPVIVQPADDILSLRSRKVLTWILPLVFVALAQPLVLLRQPFTPATLGKLLLFCGTLVLLYVFTNRFRHPLLVQAGLAGQSVVVLTLVIVTQTMPLLLGVLLVMWQIALRLPAAQMATAVFGLQMSTGLMLARVLPLTDEYGTYLLVAGIGCAAVVVLVSMARRQLNHRRADEARLARLSALARALEQQEAGVRALAAAAERTRLARELHDDLGYRLVLLNVQLQLVEELIAEDPDAALAQLVTTREQVSAAWSSVLATTEGELLLDGASLVPALQALILPYRSRPRPAIELAISGELTRLPPAVACAVYRAIQEGMTNACKYANARQIVVQLVCEPDRVQVSVCDDGCGAAPAGDLPVQGTTPARQGFGLAGLRERAALLGGSVDAGPLPEGGFGLHLTLPLQETPR